MKTLRKYANMAFLLISVATILPAYANPTINEQEKVTQETMVEPQKTETIWYKRPEVHEKIKRSLETTAIIGYGIGVLALMYYVVIPTLAKVSIGPKVSILPPGDIICLHNGNVIIHTDDGNIITLGKPSILSTGWIKINKSNSLSFLIEKHFNSFCGN